MSLLEIKIGQLFKYTIPGEWGSDGDAETGVPVLRSTNFSNDGTLDLSDIAYREVPKAKLKRRQIQAGDILIEKSGGSPNQPAGRVVFCPVSTGGTASNFIEVCKVNDQFDKHFVFYLLYTLYQHGRIMKYQQQTTGIINFKLTDYKEEIVVVPDTKEEQHRIAERILELEKLIAQTEALITKHERIHDGLLYDLLTRGVDAQGRLRSDATHQFKDSPLGRIPVEWVTPRLESILESSAFGPRFPGSSYDAYGNVATMRTTDIDSFGNINLKQMPLAALNLKRFSNHILKVNDVLITRSGTCGITSIFQGFSMPVLPGAFLIRLRLRSITNARYLKLFLSTGIGKKNLLDLAEGAVQKNIRGSAIKQLLISLPEETEQVRILSIVAMQEEKVAKAQEQLTKLQLFKAGLMHDLLTPPSPATETVIAEEAETLSA